MRGIIALSMLIIVIGVISLSIVLPVILEGVGKGAAKVSEAYRANDTTKQHTDTVYVMVKKQ